MWISSQGRYDHFDTAPYKLKPAISIHALKKDVACFKRLTGSYIGYIKIHDFVNKILVANWAMMVYNIFRSGACQGCTNRGVSGSLLPEIRYMQGLIPFQRIQFFVVCLVCKAVRDRSRATNSRETCQAGNRAALSGTICVPRQTGFEPSIRVTGKGCFRRNGVQPWESLLFYRP